MKVLKRLILPAVLLFIVFITWSYNLNKSLYPELKYLKEKSLSFDELKTYFTDLSRKKGAIYAFEVLKIAPYPPNTDTHLLGHVVGDILYTQQGADAIKICTEDFRNACSHSIVVGLFTDKGEDSLSEIKEACKNAPGGIGAYIMCYHGLGHGILAYTGYDFPKTIGLCQKTGTFENGNREYAECISGAVMEIISGGGHDRHLWVRQRPFYLKVDDPFYTCSPPFMPEEARSRCYDYLTPFLWEVVGGDINNPNERDFRESFKLCHQITEGNFRKICFGGFGKEFVGLAQSRDIRKVDQMGDDKFGKIVEWCNLASEKEGINECLAHALNSIFWGGENDYHASIRFCNIIYDSGSQNKCFLNLINQVSYYIKDSNIKATFCQEIPAQFSDECRKIQ